MEERKNNEEQKAPQEKFQAYKQDILNFVKKQPWILGAVAIVLIAVVIAFATLVNPTTSNKEITAYLNDSSKVPFGELIVSSVYEKDNYVTEDDAFVSAPNGKKVIRVFGEIRNTTDKKQSISADMFRLNDIGNDERRPKSYAFFDRSSYFFNSVTIPANHDCYFDLFYLVDEEVVLEECKLIVYSAVIALKNEQINLG